MKNFWIGFLRVTSLVLVLVVLGVAGYFYYQNQNLKKQNVDLLELKKNPEKLSEQAAKELKEIVGKIMLLPTDEEPQIAVVQDVEKLKTDQPFFVNAANEDKVLIFSKAKKAILYRPSENKIIEVGPVTTEGAASQTTKSN